MKTKKKCPQCHGTGNVLIEHVSQCSRCGGTGKYKKKKSDATITVSGPQGELTTYVFEWKQPKTIIRNRRVRKTQKSNRVHYNKRV